jgi:hypothetical protein
LFAPFATTTTTTTFFSFSLFDNQNYLGYLARLCLVEIKRSSIIRWENRSQFFCFVWLFSGHRWWKGMNSKNKKEKDIFVFIFLADALWEGRDAPPTVEREREREKHVWHFIPLDLSSALCVAVCFVFGRVIFSGSLSRLFFHSHSCQQPGEKHTNASRWFPIAFATAKNSGINQHTLNAEDIFTFKGDVNLKGPVLKKKRTAYTNSIQDFSMFIQRLKKLFSHR